MSVQLTLEDVRVALGGNEILHGVSLDIAPGEFLTLLGPSGSGKTTTLNVIAGLVPTSGGHVRFDQQPVEKRPPHDRDIGLVFQSYALFPHMTVGENVAFPLLTRKVDKAKRRAVAEQMLELVQLPGTADRPVRSLSGGQQQRIALARALAPSPSVLLLDEPMAALDKQLRETMQIEVKRIQQEVGVTTVAVTHDQTEAMTMSDRVAIMRDGNVEQIDTPEALYRRPATLFAARFLGETNLVAVRDGRLAGFGTGVGARSGTAVLRPEDFALGGDLPGSAPRLSVRVTTASFQGTRYRLDVVHDEVGAMIVTLPASTDPTTIAPGTTIELALNDGCDLHVVPEDVESEPPLVSADLTIAA
ncbi:polyamine ABC transporter ATP-binding protein [Patulibacter medicamentivorans]|uniref:ABC-type quaternary amine transporter n=1 Tax=Patulibacter medicamentivorans TaxID=1097667 RepID=H0E316_9ACTN|nr:ABC transporter ATP-binding protein [Patulibacter medicamentivorans]EHN11925.1 polyamine ABC transporter ATP-binding protein [Patulibacter medicamentivorans]